MKLPICLGPFLRVFLGLTVFVGFGGGAFAQAVAKVSLNPHTVVGGHSTTGTVAITSAAGAGGFSVDLSSVLPDRVTVPTSVEIPPGSTSATFAVGTAPHGRTLVYAITAMAGQSSQKANLTVLGDAVANLSLNPSTIVAGKQSSTGTVTLLSPAPAWGWTVDLKSSAPEYAYLPTSITIPAGSSSGTFEIETVYHSRTIASTISAYDKTSTKSETLTAQGDGIARVTVSPLTIKAGHNSSGTVELIHPAPVWGWRVKLSTSGASNVSVPAAVTIPAGASVATFPVTTLASNEAHEATITAYDYTTRESSTLNVEPGGGWDAFHGNSARTGLGAGSGATGKVVWSVNINAGESLSCPVLAPDGTIYVGSADGNLYAVSAAGAIKWKFQTGGRVWGSAAVGQDGTVYVGSEGNNFYAISPTGVQKWVFPTGNQIQSSPAIGTDGTIYIGSYDGNTYAINPDGSEKWATPIASVPSIGPDGTIYLGGAVLAAVTPSGHTNWTFNTSGPTAPTVGPDGTLYVNQDSGILYAIRSDGTEKWVFKLTPYEGYFVGFPAVGADGTVYAPNMNGTLVAIDPSGHQKWIYTLSGSLGGPETSPAVGSDGVIYVPDGNGNLYAVNPDGTKHWTIPYGIGYTSPAIGPDGTIYQVTLDGILHAIH